MKLLITALLFASAVHAADREQYVPEVLVSTALIAPPAVARTVAAKAGSELRDCLRELRLKSSIEYLRAVRVQLNFDTLADYLVVPSARCSSLFGAHAIRLWLVRGNTDGSYSIVGSSSVDAITLLDSVTNGYRDILLSYNRETSIHRYDGRKYVGREL